jgi:phosphorylcholine metabolism protein LicD
MFSGLNTRYVCSIDPNINKYIFKKDTIFPLKEVKFENRILKIPNKIDEYLQILYGNDFNIPKKNKILLYEVVIDGKKYI